MKERAEKLKRDIPALFLALRRKDTPAAAKLFALLTVSYALSPVDLIPDFIPLLGYLDDIILLPLLAALTIRLVPAEIMTECRHAAEGMWADGRAKRWYYAVPIVLVWLAVLIVIFKQFIY